MNDKETLRRLRQWDPAADAAPPSDELNARIRARLAGSRERRASDGWLDSLWAVAAVTAAGAVLVAVTLTRVERTGDPAAVPATAAAGVADEDARPVQLVYTASNGVRVYWSVASAPASRM